MACHQFGFLGTRDVLGIARHGATVLLNAPFPADMVWDALPAPVQQQIIDKDLQVHAIEAHRIARESGLGGRINTVMQPCFFALAGILPDDEAMAAIRASIRRTYGRGGEEIVERNLRAVDLAIAALAPVPVGSAVTSTAEVRTQLAALTAPAIDLTAPGTTFVIGSDRPADVPCTVGCP